MTGLGPLRCVPEGPYADPAHILMQHGSRGLWWQPVENKGSKRSSESKERVFKLRKRKGSLHVVSMSRIVQLASTEEWHTTSWRSLCIKRKINKRGWSPSVGLFLAEYPLGSLIWVRWILLFFEIWDSRVGHTFLSYEDLDYLFFEIVKASVQMWVPVFQHFALEPFGTDYISPEAIVGVDGLNQAACNTGGVYGSFGFCSLKTCYFSRIDLW